MEVAGDGGATDDVLCGHAEVGGHREGSGPGGCSRETQHTLHTQPLPQNLQSVTHKRMIHSSMKGK